MSLILKTSGSPTYTFDPPPEVIRIREPLRRGSGDEQGYRETYTDVNVPIFMQGSLSIYVEVHAGDWIFGDSDGVVVIPKDLAAKVLVEAEDIVKRENEGRAKMRAGMDPREVREKYHVG